MKELTLFFMVVAVMFCCSSAVISGTKDHGKHKILSLVVSLHVAKDSQCSNKLNFKSIVETQALIYAVEKVNNDSNFQFSLGYEIKDVCNKNIRDLSDIFNRTLKPVAFLIDLPTQLSRIVVFESKGIPVFTLNEQKSHKDLFILETNGTRLGKVVKNLLLALNWIVFDSLVLDKASSYKLFKDAINGSKLCENFVVFQRNLSLRPKRLTNESFPLIVFSKSLETLRSLPVALKGRQFVIASERMSLDVQFSNSLLVRQRIQNVPQFKTFFQGNVFNNSSWLNKIIRGSAQYKDCRSGNESCLSEVFGQLTKELYHAGKIIDAVYTTAHALKNEPKRRLTDDNILSTPKFRSPTGRIMKFSRNRYLQDEDYGVYNLDSHPAMMIGNIQTSPVKTVTQLSKNDLKTWKRNNNSCLVNCPIGQVPVNNSNKCCIECENENSTVCIKGYRLNKDSGKCVEVKVDYLKWKHPASVIIFVLVIVLFCALVYLVNIYHKKSQIPTISMSKVAVMPLLLSLFTTLIYPLFPIIKPSITSCNAYVFVYYQAFGIPMCILLSRCHSSFRRFRREDGTLRIKFLRLNPQNVIAIFLILFQIILSIIFIVVCSAHVVNFKTADPYVDYIECSTFSGGEFLFPFFYIIILSILFTATNFGALTNQEDAYESHFTAIFFFMFYFISFLNIIVIYSVEGKVKIMSVCLFGIFHLLNFIIFLFLPKAYVIVLKRNLSSFSPFPLNSDPHVFFLEFSENPEMEVKNVGEKKD